MNYKWRSLAEGNSTLVTFIGLFPSMNPLVLNEVILPDEGSPTLTAFVRLLSSMDSLMHNEGRTLAEGFPTIMAFVWFFPGVGLCSDGQSLPSK